jgi:hypothetical protein
VFPLSLDTKASNIILLGRHIIAFPPERIPNLHSIRLLIPPQNKNNLAIGKGLAHQQIILNRVSIFLLINKVKIITKQDPMILA